jgi:putative spermidine/putrescine transport system ATP-binding protein
MELVEQTRSTSVPVQTFPRSSGSSLVLEDIVHRFGEMVALKDIDLSIQPGEFVSLLGPSGCGKTTLLRIISGFLKPSSGKILLNGKSVETLAAADRGVGIVFQNYALFPHMTVWDNIAYGLRAKRMPKAKVNGKVGEMLELIQLGHLAKRYPSDRPCVGSRTQINAA